MTDVEILILFQDIFNIKNEINDWSYIGDHSIIIHFKDTSLIPFKLNSDKTVIFTARDSGYWKLETM